MKKLRADMKVAHARRHRRMLVVSGGSAEKQGILAAYAVQRIGKLMGERAEGPIRILYMYHDEFDTSRLRKETFKAYMKAHASKKSLGIERTIDVFEKTDRYLGTTFEILVLDLNDDLKPNDIGRLAEVVRGGGLIVMLVPPWSEWDRKLTIFKQKLLVPGCNEPRHVFISWFKMKLLKSNGIYIYDAGQDKPIKKPVVRKLEQTSREEERWEPRGSVFPEALYEMTLTRDQYEAVKLLETLVPKPRNGKKTVIVITSDRGRGKSCAVGIGLVGIAEALKPYKHKVRILVTAPSPTNVQSLFILAKKAAETIGHKIRMIEREGSIIELTGPHYTIEYWEPIVIPKLKGDVVAVDEASGIHVPQLMRIYDAHDRLVFTATIHGYEGAGRGFSIRFLGALRQDPRADLKTLELKTPIRYGADDPIERWLYDTLLLDAEPAHLDEEDLKAISEGVLRYVRLDPHELFTEEKEELLRQLFGIYVLAHYRNQPDDLGLLADAPHHLIRAVVLPSSKVVCSLQVAVEGGLDSGMVDSLLRGNKMPGNIIPDRLLKHLRIREIGSLRGYRIVRIATHPQIQGRGIGSFAMKKLYEEAREEGMDWIGSGFGVNYQLLKFWVKNSFVPLHMSPDRNPVSGEYTVIVLNPISSTARRIVELGRRVFLRKLLKSLRDVYRDLETDVALLIIKSIGGIDSGELRLSPIDVDRLWIYAFGPMTYEALSDVMYEIAMHYFTSYGKTRISLSEKKEWVLLAKVLQCKPWEQVAKEIGEGETKTMFLLKEVAQEIARVYFGRDYLSEVGLALEGEEGDGQELWRA
uniref:tRNA(Met) cytidine acetyltransferase TmcA n=1 Tax=Fervidicoccus fontis TaxID=683846 RepID=A0A7J3ZIS3_9CREN